MAARMVAAWPSQPIPMSTLEVWFAELAQFPAGDVEAAFWEHLRRSSYLPSCAELREGARAVAKEQERVSRVPELPQPREPIPPGILAEWERLGLRKPRREGAA